MSAAIRPAPPAHRRLLAEAVRYVSAYLDIPAPDLIAGCGRGVQTTFGRHLVFYALAQYGLNPAQISRVTERNHSTILHALDALARYPERHAHLAAFTASLPLSLRAWGTYTLLDALKAALRGMGEADRINALSYLTGDLLGHRAPPWQALHRYEGHRVLMAHPDLAAELQTVLGYFGEHGAAASLADQVRKHRRRAS